MKIDLTPAQVDRHTKGEMMPLRVTWEVEDGYVGAARPQFTDIPDEEFKDCETEEDRQEVIQVWVQQEFEENISWTVTDTYQEGVDDG